MSSQTTRENVKFNFGLIKLFFGGVEQRIDYSGIRTNDLRINQLSYLALYGQCPYFVNIFVRIPL